MSVYYTHVLLDGGLILLLSCPAAELDQRNFLLWRQQKLGLYKVLSHHAHNICLVYNADQGLIGLIGSPITNLCHMHSRTQTLKGPSSHPSGADRPDRPRIAGPLETFNPRD